LLVTAGAIASPVQAQDWPRWRGADGDGVAENDDWSPEGRRLWSRNVGPGFSSAAVVGDRLYTLGFEVAASADTVYCLDAGTGAELWKTSYPGRLNTADRHDGGTLSSPAVADARVYVTSGSGWLRALDAGTGAVVWERAVAREVGTVPDEFGFSASPILHGDEVIVCMDRVVGLDARTGEIRWRSEPEGVDHSTPTLFELSGAVRLVAFGKDELCVLELGTGLELHSYPWHEGHVGKSISTPVAIGERIFISSGENRGCALLEFGGGEARARWTGRVMRNTMAGCVLVDEFLFGFDESLLKCVDLDGNERWRQRGLGNGALTAAGKELVVLSSKGELIVADASAAGYRERWRARLFEDGTFWSPPVFAHGRIYARSSLGDVVCTDHRGGATPAPAPAERAAPALPDARSLFARHLELVGGAGRVRAVRSLRMRGEFELLSMGVRSVAVEVQQLAPDLRREEIQFPHGLPDKVVRVFDGEIAWELNRVLGDRILEEDDWREARESWALHAAADWERSYRSMRTAGLVEFADRPAYRVETVLASGTPRTVYFDAATGFLLGREGESEAVVVYDGWRAFDGLWLPTYEKRFLEHTGIEETLRFREVELDTVAPEAFARPAKIVELLEQR
jgi:outer membrane protein assembly factor BamB